MAERMKQNKLASIGLEKGKTYIVKCRKDLMREYDMLQLSEELHKRGIDAIVVGVFSNDAITIQENIHEPKRKR